MGDKLSSRALRKGPNKSERAQTPSVAPVAFPPGARPLPPVFAECYGGVAIGDRGGIICKGTRLHAPLKPN
jgi:hypothetical protein